MLLWTGKKLAHASDQSFRLEKDLASMRMEPGEENQHFHQVTHEGDVVEREICHCRSVSKAK